MEVELETDTTLLIVGAGELGESGGAGFGCNAFRRAV